MNTKLCFRCSEVKPLEQYYKNVKRIDGVQSYCKSCMKIENQKNYQKHKETWDERSKRYAKTDSAKEYRRNWANDKYHNDEEHRKTVIKRVVDYERQQLKSNLEYKIKHNLRSRLSSAIRSQSCGKYRNTEKLTGCSVKILREHIERLFDEKMSWENYGEWHIDHIRPCCSFDLSNEDEQLECFHYTNLQPLWAKDNLSKGSKYKA